MWEERDPILRGSFFTGTLTTGPSRDADAEKRPPKIGRWGKCRGYSSTVRIPEMKLGVGKHREKGVETRLVAPTHPQWRRGRKIGGGGHDTQGWGKKNGSRLHKRGGKNGWLRQRGK